VVHDVILTDPDPSCTVAMFLIDPEPTSHRIELEQELS